VGQPDIPSPIAYQGDANAIPAIQAPLTERFYFRDMSSDFPNTAEPGCGGVASAEDRIGVSGLFLTALPEFTQPGLIDLLEGLGDQALDNLSFGLIGMAMNGHVELYNKVESRLSGLSPSRVIGRHLFTQVAPCTNNYMIGHRFETEAELDATIDYVFTFRMAPTWVRLRLLKRPGARRTYLAVERR
jgi:photoactive yellow protein